jgi:hypothetical protein
MKINDCTKCGHICHCVLDKKEHRLLSECICGECKCQDRNEDASYENNSSLIRVVT